MVVVRTKLGGGECDTVIVCSVTAGSGSLLVTTAKQKSMENKFQGEREGWEKAYLPPNSA